MRKLILLLCVLFPLQAFCQVTLSGYVRDVQTGEALIGAYVIAISKADSDLKFISVANDYGFYSLTLPSGNYSLGVSMMGFTFPAETLSVENTDIRKNLLLLPAAEELGEVTVVAEKSDEYESKDFTSPQISRSIIKRTPSLGGESDLMKTIQLLPGIKQGKEGDAGIHVRGGSPDQSLILVDGAPVYNIYHLFGLLSVFNTEAIQNVSIYRGGISSRYEGRLSSVIDISLKEGNKTQSRKRFSISPIAGSFMVEGPVKRDKASFILSGRRTWLDAVSNLFNGGASDKRGYNFTDLSGKVNWQPSDRHSFYAGYYHSRDKFYDELSGDNSLSSFFFKWSNHTLMGRYTYEVSPKVFFTAKAYNSRYIYRQQNSFTNEENSQFRQVNSFINDASLQTSIEYYPNTTHSLHLGLDHHFKTYDPSVVQVVSYDKTVAARFTSPVETYSASFFLEDKITLGAWYIQAGVRNTYFTSEGYSTFVVQPHMLTTYKVNKQWEVKASFDRVNQFVHLLTNSALGQSVDLWVPATGVLPAQSNDQIVAGAEYRPLSRPYAIGIEVYSKTMNGVIEYKDGASYLYGDDSGWEDKVVNGKGRAKGIEFLIKKENGRLTGWLGYTIARSEREFAEINNGHVFPYKYDRTHDASVFCNYRLSEHSALSGTFTYRTGNAFTLPTANVANPVPPFWDDDILNPIGEQPFIRSRNNARMPAFHRLDVSYENSKELKNDKVRTWVVSVYNVYNRLNPYFIYEKDGQLRQYALFPVLPSVSYSLAF